MKNRSLLLSFIPVLSLASCQKDPWTEITKQEWQDWAYMKHETLRLANADDFSSKTGITSYFYEESQHYVFSREGTVLSESNMTYSFAADLNKSDPYFYAAWNINGNVTTTTYNEYTEVYNAFKESLIYPYFVNHLSASSLDSFYISADSSQYAFTPRKYDFTVVYSPIDTTVEPSVTVKATGSKTEETLIHDAKTGLLLRDSTTYAFSCDVEGYSYELTVSNHGEVNEPVERAY